MYQQSSSLLQCDPRRALLSAPTLPKCHRHCARSSPRGVTTLSQAQYAQKVGSKSGGAPSLSLKGLETVLSKDSAGSRRVESRRDTAEDRIVVIDAPSSSKRESSSRQQKGKPSRAQPAAVGSVRHHTGKGSRQSKISNDSTERLAKASQPPDILKHPKMSSRAVPCSCTAFA